MANYRATVRATALGQQIRNVFHVQNIGATQGEVAGSLRNAWQTDILPVLGSAYLLDSVEVINIGTDGVGAVAPRTGAGLGLVAGETYAGFVCASVRLLTDRRGRAGAGRMGLGPLTEGQILGNSLTAAARTAITTAVTNFRTNISSSGGTAAMNLTVVSEVVNGLPRAERLFSEVTGISVNDVLGTRLSRHPTR